MRPHPIKLRRIVKQIGASARPGEAFSLPVMRHAARAALSRRFQVSPAVRAILCLLQLAHAVGASQPGWHCEVQYRPLPASALGSNCIEVRWSYVVLRTASAVVMIRNTTLFGCSYFSCCGLTADGVYCWGSNMDATKNFLDFPPAANRIPGIPDSLRLLAFHGPDGAACAIAAPLMGVGASATNNSNTIWCWGNPAFVSRGGGSSRMPGQVMVSAGEALSGVLDMSCYIDGCGVLALTGGAVRLYSIGNPVQDAFPRAAPTAYARLYLDADNILPRALGAIRPESATLACSSMACCVTSPLGVHCLGSGVAQMMRSSQTNRFFVDASKPLLVSDSGIGAVASIWSTDNWNARSAFAALVRNGTLLMRAADASFSFGLSTSASASVWTAVPTLPTGQVASVSLSARSTAVILRDGTAFEWHGSSRASLVQIPESIAFTAAATGDVGLYANAFVTASGALWLGGQLPEFAWGVSNSTSIGSYMLAQLGNVTGATTACVSLWKDPRTSILSASVCYTTSVWKLVCGGSGTAVWSAFGLPATSSLHPYATVPTISNATSVVCTGTAYCVLLTNGSVTCAGSQRTATPTIGIGGGGASNFQLVPLPEPVSSISMGSVNGAVGLSGAVYSWVGGVSLPRQTNIPMRCSSVNCGTDNCAAVCGNGSVWFWGTQWDLLMTDPPPELEEPAALQSQVFRSAPSLLAPLQGLRFGPTTHDSASAGGDLRHQCIVRAPGGRGGYACAANETHVQCWGSLPFSMTYDTEIEREGAGASELGAAAAVNRPLTPVFVAQLSTPGLALPAAMRAIQSLQCDAAGVSVVTKGATIGVSDMCRWSLRLPADAVPDAGVVMRVLPLGSNGSVTPASDLVLLFNLQLTGAGSTGLNAQLQRPSDNASVFVGHPAGTHLVSHLLVPVNGSNGNCPSAGLLVFEPVVDAGETPWLRTTAFAVLPEQTLALVATSSLQVCVAVNYDTAGESGIWCGALPATDALIAAVQPGALATVTVVQLSRRLLSVPAAAVQLAWTDTFGLCVLRSDGRLQCQQDPLNVATAPWTILHRSAASVAAAAASLCLTTTARTILCFGNNTRGEAGWTGVNFTDARPWIAAQAAADVPGLTPPPRRPAWHTVTVLSSSCYGQPVYSARAFGLTGCPAAGSSLAVNFTGGGPFPAGTLVHVHASAAVYTTAALHCSYADVGAANGGHHWCAFTAALPPLTDVFAAGMQGLTLHTSYSDDAGGSFRSCEPSDDASPGLATSTLGHCMETSTAPVVALLRSVLSLPQPQRSSLGNGNSANACNDASAACPRAAPEPQWDEATRTLSGLSSLQATEISILFDGPATTPVFKASTIVRVCLQRGLQTADCGNASVLGGRLQCTLPPLLGGGYALFATYCSGGNACGDLSCNSTSMNNTDSKSLWAPLLLGSESVSYTGFAWAVMQPEQTPQLPSGGNASVNVTIAGLFTTLPLEAAPVLVWNRSEPCAGASEYRQQGVLSSPHTITAPVVPGYSVVQLLRVELDGWVVLPSCDPPSACSLLYESPVISTVSARYSASAGGYAVTVTGSGLGTLSCTPLKAVINGRIAVTAIPLGDNTHATFAWVGSLQPTSTVQLFGGGGFVQSSVTREIVIDPGCKPFSLCGLGLSAYPDGAVTLVLLQESIGVALTASAMELSTSGGTSAELHVYKRAGTALWPPLRVLAVDLHAIAAAAADTAALHQNGLGLWLTNSSTAEVPATLSREFLGSAFVPESSTTCTLVAGAATTSVVLSAGAVGGTEMSLPSSVADVDGALLSVSCVRDGTLRLALPSIRLHVQPLQMLAAPVDALSLAGSSAADFHATAVSGQRISPPLSILFPLPAEVERALIGSEESSSENFTRWAIPLASPPCHLSVTAAVLSSPVHDAQLVVAGTEFTANSSTGRFTASQTVVTAVPGTRLALTVACLGIALEDVQALPVSFKVTMQPCSIGLSRRVQLISSAHALDAAVGGRSGTAGCFESGTEHHGAGAGHDNGCPARSTQNPLSRMATTGASARFGTGLGAGPARAIFAAQSVQRTSLEGNRARSGFRGAR